MNDLMRWYRQTTEGDTINAVASRAGLVGSTLNRQIRAETLTPESIVAIARAYDADVIDALIISGLITFEDATRTSIQVLLADVSDRQLADEVWERMQRGRQSEAEVVQLEFTEQRIASSRHGYDPADQINGEMD